MTLGAWIAMKKKKEDRHYLRSLAMKQWKESYNE